MRPKTHIPLLLTAGLILGLVSYALSGASEPALTSTGTASLHGHHPPTPPGCGPKPPWALGILGDLYEFSRGPCDRCDDRNPCTNDSWRHGVCVHKALEGPRCDDGNACTRADACVAGVCEGTARECSTSKPCHTASCNPKNGKCATKPASGSSCDDGNTCTDGDVCAKGVCQGGPARDCSSDNPCQVGSCSLESGGCALTPVADGTACDGDGDVCNGAGSCRAGACVVTSSSTYVVSGTSEVPLFVEASSSGGVYVAANVSGSQNVVGQNVRADAAGDILVTELDAKGLPVFSTLIDGAGRQEVRAIATNKAGDLQVFLQTDQSIGFELDVQRCGLDGDTLFCSPPPGTLHLPHADGPIPCGFCGNGSVDHPDEECDDENQRDGDGCSSSCKREIGGVDISPTPIDPILIDPIPDDDPGSIPSPLA